MGMFDFIKKIPTINELTGSFGEWLAKLYATTYPSILVLNDVLIDGHDNYTSQIDLLLVGKRGVYVIEVKLYTDAKIYGDFTKSKWYYYSHGKKYEIYSPVKQNRKHVEYMKAFLKDFGDVPFFSIVTMICDDFKISGEKEPNTLICSSLPAMDKAMYHIAKNYPEVIDDDKKHAIYEYIKNNQRTGKEARLEHKEQVKSYNKELEKMKEQKICPYCKTELVLRKGKYGSFYGCKNYPKCKYTLKA